MEENLSLENLKILLNQAFTKVTEIKWTSCCKRVERKENESWETDGLTKDVVDKLISEMGKSSDSKANSTLSDGSESEFDDIRLLD